MSAKITSAVVDTNVWLDYFLAHRPGHEMAQRVVERAFERDVALLHTTAQAQDVFYLTALDLKERERARAGGLDEKQAAICADIAWSFLEALDELAGVVGADASDAWLARKYRSVHGDFEDNLVLAAVQRSGAGALVTSDKKLISHAPVPALSPSDFVALLEAF